MFNKCRLVPCRLLLCCSLLVIPGINVHTQTRSNSEEKAAELESVRTRIKDVETSIQAARSEADQLYLELQKNEVAAAEVSQSLLDIDDKINSGVKTLAELNVRKTSLQDSLSEERSNLAEQIRAAYKIGKNDYLKLLLNQEDPSRVGRVLSYYDYFNRTRTLRINQVKVTLDEISRVERQIQSEKKSLDEYRSFQLAKLEEFTSHRISRRSIIDRLESYIDEQDRQLQVLQRNEKELEELLSSLEEDDSLIRTFEEIAPFESLKGKLKWPVKGKLLSRFGAKRKGGKLSWQGVTIAADAGNNVEVISPGKVIFADWFRNMGLLMIIDHGDGFMSLYGHNERLLKTVGDWVTEREIIAKVGDTGGQQSANLYFEIRKSGNPLNPALWCQL